MAKTVAGTCDGADLASTIAAAYCAEPALTDEKKTKDWSFYDGLWRNHDKIVVPDCRGINALERHLVFFVVPSGSLLSVIPYETLEGKLRNRAAPR